MPARRSMTGIAVTLAFAAIGLTPAIAPSAHASVCAPGGGGSGTAGDPFLISNQSQLAAIAAPLCLSTGLHFKQTQDITLTGTWEPIGDPATTDYFRGTYDGGGASITGLAVGGTENRGLFGAVWQGTIKQVTLIAPSINAGGNHVGSLVGLVLGGTVQNSRVLGGSVTGLGFVGGLIGKTEAVSSAFLSTVTDSSSSASVHESGGWTGGGLIGFAQGTSVIRSYASGSVHGTNFVGGLIGEVDPVLRPSTCVGVTIVDSYAKGAVTGSGFSSGVGGVIGLLRSDTSDPCVPTLSRVYAVGSVASGLTRGGIAGEMAGVGGASSPAVSSTYWDTQTSGMSSAWPEPPSVSGATGKTTAEMKNIATYAGWNIAATWSPTTTWVICSTANGGYPFLAGFYSAADAPCIDLPEAPSAPTVIAGDTQATITASAGGGGTAANILITATPGSDTCTITGTSGSCTITGLANGTEYVFTATGRNAAGSSAASSPSSAVTPTAPPAPPAPAPAPAPAPTPTPTPTPTQIPEPSPSPTEIAPPPVNLTQQAIETVQQLAPSQVQELSATQMAALPPAAFAVMTPAQIRALQPRQVTSLTQEQIREISPESLQAMKPRTLARLRLTQIRSLTPEQAAALRPEQIRKLGPMKQRSVNRKR